MIGTEIDAKYLSFINGQIFNMVAVCKYIVDNAGVKDVDADVCGRIIGVSLCIRIAIGFGSDEEQEIVILRAGSMLIRLYLDTIINPLHRNNKLCTNLLVIHANLIMMLLKKLPNSREFINDIPDLSATEFRFAQ